MEQIFLDPDFPGSLLRRSLCKQIQRCVKYKQQSPPPGPPVGDSTRNQAINLIPNGLASHRTEHVHGSGGNSEAGLGSNGRFLTNLIRSINLWLNCSASARVNQSSPA